MSSPFHGQTQIRVSDLAVCSHAIWVFLSRFYYSVFIFFNCSIMSSQEFCRARQRYVQAHKAHIKYAFLLISAC